MFILPTFHLFSLIIYPATYKIHTFEEEFTRKNCTIQNEEIAFKVKKVKQGGLFTWRAAKCLHKSLLIVGWLIIDVNILQSPSDTTSKVVRVQHFRVYFIRITSLL